MADIDKKAIRDSFREYSSIDTLIGNVMVKNGIGEGGNALVYNADFGRKEVALKVLSEDAESDSSKYRRFVTEFREIVQLADTNAIVPIYYFGHLSVMEKSYPYILMKKYPYTLKSWIKEHPINDYNDMYPILMRLLDIVEVIHNENIVHRDLKPENILIDETGKMVLADFGISWFDPEFYERLAHTEKGDRMANYAFSAPEQFVRGTSPHVTMDIFAIGQIVTWAITGEVARGDRESLVKINQSYEIIEPAIRKALNINPNERPQSVSEIREIITEISKEMDSRKSFNEELGKIYKNLKTFSDVLLYSFPGKRGLIQTEDEGKINKVFTKLEEVKNEIYLYWTRGHSNSPIYDKLFMLDEHTWVLDSTEIQIEKLWAYKNNYSLDHEFIIIKTKAMTPFGIYEKNGYRSEEAAWFKDRYITRAEYDDGAIEINGDTVWIENQAEIRCRDLVPEIYFIASEFHPINLMKNDDVVEKIYEKLVAGNDLDEEDLKKLTHLKRHDMSMILD